jgi:hypothetical protein
VEVVIQGQPQCHTDPGPARIQFTAAASKSWARAYVAPPMMGASLERERRLVPRGVLTFITLVRTCRAATLPGIAWYQTNSLLSDLIYPVAGIK